ncbi:PKD domain-containing protein [Methanoplanus endosymbiosus]|uniref:PKD domain-containing protein n=1 Tax=Methanoplanus endosymbiosus TaxID=33865 RepID=A0A9E7PKM2_9EURY|nr:PKD domain-containing protein [Methanoplanus endosymbiosus]UUX91880.1 PKD domain-containing protein [Methanoplanus endosymbiosus]
MAVTEDQYGIPGNVTAENISVKSSDAGAVTTGTAEMNCTVNSTFKPTGAGCVSITAGVNVTSPEVINREIKDNPAAPVEADFENLIVPCLASGRNNQTFNDLGFTLVGDLNSGDYVEINLSNLVTAGADFSVVDAARTNDTVVTNYAASAANLTVGIASNRVRVTVADGGFVNTSTSVTLGLRDKDGRADIVDVKAGSSGHYGINFTRSDSGSVDTAKGIIGGNILNGSATSLHNDDSGQAQNFRFTFDGDFAVNEKFEIIVKNSNIEYATDMEDDYEVANADAFVSDVISYAGANTTITLTSGDDIASGTEVTVRARYVNSSGTENEPVDVAVNRLDTNNGDEFRFNVGNFIVVSPSTATVGRDTVTVSFLEIENSNSLTFTLNAKISITGPFRVNLTDFTAPFGTMDGGTFVVNGNSSLDNLSVKISEPDGTKNNYTPVQGVPEKYQITKGAYDYIELSGAGVGGECFSLTFTGKVEDLTGSAPHDVTFVINDAEYICPIVSLDMTVGSNSANKDITLVMPDIHIPVDWQNCLGGSNDDGGYSISQTSEGGYIVTGYTYSDDGDVSGHHSGEDMWVVKLFENGTPEWQRCLGGSNDDIGKRIVQTSDGGYIVTGTTKSNDGNVSGNHGGEDMWVVKLDSGGNLVWQKCLGGSNNDKGKSIVQTSEGGYIVTGYTYSNDGDVSGNHGGEDMWVVKLDSGGNLVWQKCLGGSNNDKGKSIIQTSEGSYIITGHTYSNDGDVSGYHGDQDMWVVKLDSSGTLIWQKCLGGSNDDKGESIVQTSEGGYIVTGDTYSDDGDVSSNHGYEDMWVVKLDSGGILLWQKCLGGSSYDSGKSIAQTSEGGYIVTGTTESDDGDVFGKHNFSDMWVVKLSGAGTPVWQKCLGGSSYDSGKSIVQTSDGGFIVTGYTDSDDGDVSGNHGFDDMWVVKLPAVFGEEVLAAGFTVDQTNGTLPMTVKFSDLSTGNPVSWSWSFGDGETSTLQNPEHNYTSPGNYTVSLTVTDNAGSDTETKAEYVLVYPKGDFNHNGRVDIGDAAIVSYMVINKAPVDLKADFNGNGAVDIGDASKIAYYVAGKIPYL